MKKIILISFFTIQCFSVIAQDLDFNSQTPIYPNAALSHSYPVVGTPATKVDINIIGATSKFSGTTQPRPRSNGLQSQMNFDSNTECVTFTITFSPGVTNLSFNLDEIDRGAANGTTPETYSYVDKVTVSGSIAGTSVTPLIGNDSQNGNSVSGNVITGNASTTGSSNSVTFAYADVITIQYCNGSDAQSNPLGQSMTIGDMSWDTPLPVNLTRFSTSISLRGVELFWQTAEEVNNDYFEVQRSYDAFNFETIKRVNGNGTTSENNSYSFVDEYPIEGVNYYRLLQQDLDGLKTYSKIVSQFFNSEAPLLIAYPNPLPRNELLKVKSRKIDISTLQIYNQMGQNIPFQLFETGTETLLRLPLGITKQNIYLKGVSQNDIPFTNRVVVN